MNATISKQSMPAKNGGPQSPGDDPACKGILFVVSAPSGAGKTTLCRAVLDRVPELRYSVSYTTRQPRSGERNRVAYHFIGEAEFVRGIDSGRWAEWAKVHGHYYGTSAEFIDQQLASGHDILLDIDVQGAMQIRQRFSANVSIFIMPPSKSELEKRLHSRGTDSREAIDRRMQDADAEMASRHLYRHVVVNDRLDAAIEQLVALITSYRRRSADPRR